MSDSCDPMDFSPPGSSVHEISQARILEWVAISFSRGSSQPRDQTQVSCIAGRFFMNRATRAGYTLHRASQEVPVVKDPPDNGGDIRHVSSVLQKGIATHCSILAWRTPWTLAHQAPLSMRFPRQEYWSGLPFSSPICLLR